LTISTSFLPASRTKLRSTSPRSVADTQEGSRSMSRLIHPQMVLADRAGFDGPRHQFQVGRARQLAPRSDASGQLHTALDLPRRLCGDELGHTPTLSNT